MKELKTGVVQTKELAEWFGIKPSSFNVTKQKKLEELKDFADYQIISSTKIKITKVKNPIYIKQQSKAYQLIINKIDECWNKDGLDSCKRVGQQISQELNKELALSPTTVYNYTRKGRNELYGTPFKSRGSLGYCTYLWCKKEGDGVNTQYRQLTKEEEKIKKDLIKKYFGDASEKQVIVNAMVKAGEIKKEEAWDVLTELTHMENNFMPFLFELQEKLHCQVVRGTLVTRDSTFLKKGAF